VPFEDDPSISIVTKQLSIREGNRFRVKPVTIFHMITFENAENPQTLTAEFRQKLQAALPPGEPVKITAISNIQKNSDKPGSVKVLFCQDVRPF